MTTTALTSSDSASRRPSKTGDRRPVLTIVRPTMTIHELRELGRETLEVFRAGRHADTRKPYMETWAERYWRSQEAIERDRLRKGKARHRAHRDPLPGKKATK